MVQLLNITLQIRMGNCQKDEGEEAQTINNTGPVHQMKITNYIWNKDYQGLFDYDTKSLEKKVVKVNGSAMVGKIQGNFVFMGDDASKMAEEKIKSALFRLVRKQNFYQIYPIYFESQNYTLQKLLWLVVTSLPQKCYQIQEKDILKLGKQKLRIREIVHADSNPSTTFDSAIKLQKTVYEDLTYKQNQALSKNQLQVPKEEKQNPSEITQTEKVCRICLDPGLNDNPLITPCKCSGSVKYIHLNCLRSWLAKRLNAIKNTHCITINWLPLSCEMCKTAFRYRIYMDSKKFYTVQIPKPPKPYIVIELMRKNSSSKGKVFHFISFAEKKMINLGRKSGIDVRVSDDISVSRIHASIEYNQEAKTFSIIDNKSKFGTLVLIKKGLIVRPRFKDISFQIGAEVFSFQSLRSPQQQQFVPDNGQNDDLFIQEASDEEEDMEDNGDSESENEEVQGEESPNIHRSSHANQ